MSRTLLVLPRSATPYGRMVADELLHHLRFDGHDTALLNGRLLSLLVRLLATPASVIDLHGAAVGLLAPVLRLLKRRTRITCTLHEREEFRTDLGFPRRAIVRLGVFCALRAADEVITTNKTLQYHLHRQYGTLPTYIPQGVKVSTHRSERGPRPSRALVVIGGSPADVRRVRHALRRVAPRLRVDKHFRKSAHARDEMFQKTFPARAVLILRPLRFPGRLRQLALHGRPIAALDTPEHREALSGSAVFLRSSRSPDLLAALEALLTTTAERRAARAARVMRRLYGWDTIAREFLKTYRHADLEPVHVDSLSPRTA